MIDLNLIFLPLFGFIVGLLVSMLGGGGGGLYAPILIVLFGIPAQVAVATSLASVLPTTVVGAISHYHEGNVNIRVGLILGAGGIIGTLIGASIANMISPILLRHILGVFMLIMVIPMTRSALKRYKKAGITEKNKEIINAPVTLKGTKKVFASIFGVASGIMAGVFGISGTPPITAGLYSLGLPAIMVVGTSVFVLIFNSLAGVGSYYVLGRLDLNLIILLGGGAAVGAFLGPIILKKINPKTVEKMFAPLLVSISLIFGVALLLA
jgi:uncharacterized protein